MHAQRSCTVSKKTLTSPSSQSSTRQRSAKSEKDTMQEERSFCTRGSSGVISSKDTLKGTAAQVMIRLCGLQWYAWTRGQTRHFSQEGKEYQDAKIDGQTEQNIVSACKKPAARAKPWNVGTKSQVNLRRTTRQMTPQRRQEQCGNQRYVVRIAARGRPTRYQRVNVPELGQAHRARMNHQSTQRATLSRAGTSSVQAQ